ncbi:phosphoribosylformylglycinamidine cyclo-ligase [Halanaerobium hydrogeniformans]|uniref:Phosphoribosylformylglycinamidine cyclo-ligase n=1 Tax=Halanaerobium hydrogeniformans TaxID=656519 RepID=E4RKK9_HALHG|nr:phosphoribosylformylglycinamidine cyclo-ligase [Halanaerobium hydrogeniformans]ADQ15656.1 phosphoribosylformylglycinamidine cyclo-ligase [Halanaerobium hydrogeniformans]
MGLNYKESGVDIDAGKKAVNLMKKDVEATHGPEVLNSLGGFGGLFQLDLGKYEKPVLVSGTDGVGTKLKLAFKLDKHDSIGIDLVAMSVNDILAQGAKPLFFLDYLATGKLEPEKTAQIVRGIALGCQESSAALIGGETAEMAGFYKDGEYDLAGFAVGIVDRSKIITGQNIKEGNLIIGLASNGLHSNGFTLARAALFNKAGYDYQEKIPGLENNLGEELLKPTRIYVKSVLSTLEDYYLSINGIAHITGGGLIENIIRILPEQLAAEIDSSKWEQQKIFKIIQEAGKIDDFEMLRTFNMGIGMVLIIDPSDKKEIMSELKAQGESPYQIGEIEKSQDYGMKIKIAGEIIEMG